MTTPKPCPHGIDGCEHTEESDAILDALRDEILYDDPKTPPKVLDRIHAERYPEHAKLRALGAKPQCVGEFISWLRRSGMEVCEAKLNPRKTDITYDPVHSSITQLLEKYFQIDNQLLNDEKEAMLEALRGRNERDDAAKKPEAAGG